MSELLVSQLNIFAIFRKLLTKTRTVSYELVFKEFICIRSLYAVLLFYIRPSLGELDRSSST